MDLPLQSDQPKLNATLLETCPKTLVEALTRAVENRPELFGTDETSLKRLLQSEHCQPTDTDDALRLRFWHAHEESLSTGKKMTVTQIVSGICSPSLITGEYLKRPEKLAWLVCVPKDLDHFRKTTLYYSTMRLREILEWPLESVDPMTGKKVYNLKHAELLLKIHTMLDMRVNGAVEQKILQRSVNLNVSATDKSVQNVAALETMEDIERRLNELRKKDRRQLIEVKPEGQS